MAITTVFSERPEDVLDAAGTFLVSRPVLHNLVLSLLRDRVAHPQPGRYWVVNDDRHPVGVVFQSPLDFLVTVTPMPDEAVVAVVSAIADAGIRLPGVNGEAATAARFAGQWTEVRETAAEPVQGQRIYEVDQVAGPPPPPGQLRKAQVDDGASSGRGCATLIRTPASAAATLSTLRASSIVASRRRVLDLG